MSTAKKKAAKKTAKRKAQAAKNEAARDGAREAHRQADIEPSKEMELAKGPDDRGDGEMYFHPEDMLRLQLLTSQFHRAEQEVRQCGDALRINELEYLNKAAKIHRRSGEANVRMQQAKGTLARFNRAIERRYGFKLDTVTYDDETGLITLPDQE